MITDVPKNLIYISRMKKIPLICKKHGKAYLILIYYKSFLFYLQFTISLNFYQFFLSSPFHKICLQIFIGNFIQTKFDWLLTKRTSCNSIALNPSWTSSETEKIRKNFAMRNFRYIQGLLKNTLTRVETKDLKLVFLTTSSMLAAV